MRCPGYPVLSAATRAVLQVTAIAAGWSQRSEVRAANPLPLQCRRLKSAEYPSVQVCRVLYSAGKAAARKKAAGNSKQQAATQQHSSTEHRSNSNSCRIAQQSQQQKSKCGNHRNHSHKTRALRLPLTLAGSG